MGKNMLIAQSGGPTAAINASLSGAVQQARCSGQIGKVYGARFGVEGILKGNIVDLDGCLRSEEDFHVLECTPSMALGSCRYKLPAPGEDGEVYRRLLQALHEYEIGYFFYIGGNDSMDTVAKLSRYFAEQGEDIKVAGVPKTIDNDLAETDHSPGFGSAAKFIATAVQEIIRDASVYDTRSVTIVEIMGRDAGWLTASSALARDEHTGAPHLIYLPEVPFSVADFLGDVERLHKEVKNVVVAVSEGVRTADGRYAAESYQSGVVDTFGHRYLSGVGKYLENMVRHNIGCKVRSVELNVLQRAAAHVLSATDIDEARGVGQVAVRFALEGKTGFVAVIRRASQEPYEASYDCAPIERIANVARNVPPEWITPERNDVTGEMLRYLEPLILGEVRFPTERGLPKHFLLRA